MGPKEWSEIAITVVERVGIPYSIIIALLYLGYKIGMPIVASLAAITQLLNDVSNKLTAVMSEVGKDQKQ